MLFQNRGNAEILCSIVIALPQISFCSLTCLKHTFIQQRLKKNIVLLCKDPRYTGFYSADTIPAQPKTQTYLGLGFGSFGSGTSTYFRYN